MAQQRKSKSASQTAVAEAMPTFLLPDKTVKIELVEKAPMFIREQRTRFNPFTKGLGDKTAIEYDLPKSSAGGRVNPFNSVEEREYLEERLYHEKDWLDVRNRNSTFWKDYRIGLGKLGRVLKLNQPEDYLFYLVARAQKDLVAPSEDEYRNNPKATYKFMIVDQSLRDRREAESITTKSEAYVHFNKLKNNATMLRHILIESMGGSRLPTGANNHSWLIKEIDKLVDAEPTKFLEIAGDPNLEVRAFIHDAVQLQVLERMNGLYYTKDGKPLALAGGSSDLRGAVDFLIDDNNNELYLTLQSQVEKARE